MFSSFFFAGFESTVGYNARKEWIDQIAATDHERQADGDYRRLREAGLLVAREAIRWPLVDRAGRYDFSSVRPLLAASRKHRIQVIWDLFHYGYPAELDPLSAEFVERFAQYCRAAAAFVCAEQDFPCYFTPVNEPSYLAWAAGHVGRFAPHLHGRGSELKIALARAAIAGINAIRDVRPDARIVNVDPLCRVAAPEGRPELEPVVDHFNEEVVHESWDMLAGRLYPELGGSRSHLDIIGINYYWTNQWEYGRDECPLDDHDPRRLPLSDLIRRTWQRYGGDLLITETSHVGDGRAAWIDHVAAQCAEVLREGLPLRGVCLYPILGMPEWHAPEEWVPMGLWDIAHREPARRRVVHAPAWDALQRAQAFLQEEFQLVAEEVAVA